MLWKILCYNINLRLEVVIDLTVGLKLTVFLKEIFYEDFYAIPLAMHYPKNLICTFGGMLILFL